MIKLSSVKANVLEQEAKKTMFFKNFSAKDMIEIMSEFKWDGLANPSKDIEFAAVLPLIGKTAKANVNKSTDEIKSEYFHLKSLYKELFWPAELIRYEKALISADAISKIASAEIGRLSDESTELTEELSEQLQTLSHVLKTISTVLKDLERLRASCIKALSETEETKGTSITKSAFEDGV